MSQQVKRPLIGVVSLLLIGAFLFTLGRSTDPQPTLADEPAPPTTSILFLIDSSRNMFPWDGTDYFQLAVDGIVKFMNLPGFPATGKYEIGVMQFTQHGARGYIQASANEDSVVHWIPPTVISTESDWEMVVRWLERMRPFAHPTSSLMDMGLREAPQMFTSQLGSQAAAGTKRHVILIGTGEYRLPPPCPPPSFMGQGFGTCESVDYRFVCNESAQNQVCNRSCYVRGFANGLRSSIANAAPISTIRVGPDWHNYYSPCDGSGEIPAEGGSPETGDAPYANSSNYCLHPPQPDRGGFMREIAGWRPASSPFTGCPDAADVGETVRIPPLVQFGCSGGECKPGTAKDIAKAIAGWLCEWEESPNTNDGDGLRDLCDNCVNVSNLNQRDCNNDGVGDACQTTDQCGNATGDSDDDGLCDGLDTCDGGDDCLVRYWVADDPDGKCTNPDDLSTCGCDCDGSQIGHPEAPGDICQSAIEQASDTIPITSHDLPNGGNGIPDCAEGTEPTCYPVPEYCDLAAIVSAPENSSHSYRLAFGNYGGSPLPSPKDWLENHEWTVVGGLAAAGVLSINPTTPYGNTTTPDGHGVLTVNLGSTAGSIASPLFKLPPVRECTFCGSATNCPYLGPWSFLAVEIDFRIGSGGTGSDCDIFVYDACKEASPARERVHLALHDVNPHVGSGRVNIAQPVGVEACTFDPDVPTLCYSQIEYTKNEWERLRILLNNTDAYRCNAVANACEFSPVQESSVGLVRKHLQSTGTKTQKGYYESDATLFPGGDVEHDLGGMQIVIAIPGWNGTRLELGKIEIKPISGCEFWEASPCTGSNHCHCQGSGQWSCTSGASCGFWD